MSALLHKLANGRLANVSVDEKGNLLWDCGPHCGGPNATNTFVVLADDLPQLATNHTIGEPVDSRLGSPSLENDIETDFENERTADSVEKLIELIRQEQKRSAQIDRAKRAKIVNDQDSTSPTTMSIAEKPVERVSSSGVD